MDGEACGIYRVSSLPFAEAWDRMDSKGNTTRTPRKARMVSFDRVRMALRFLVWG